VLAVKQFLTYTNGTPFQSAIATGLGLPDAFFTGIAQTLRANATSSATASVQRASGLDAFRLVLHRRRRSAFLTDGEDAADFCRRLPERVGVVGIPLTAFVSPRTARLYELVRFAACKRVEVIADASGASALA
jgi:N-succinyldiaminopimelate aminotransferase